MPRIKRAKRLREASPASSINSEEVICDCPDKDEGSNIVSQDRRDYFICAKCAGLQHLKCYGWDQADKSSPLHYRCNPCQATEIEDLEKTIQERQAQIQAFADAVTRKHEEVKKAIMRMLWRHYCLLPDGDATDAVKDACKMKFEGGKMVPVQAAPQSWVEAVEKNLEEMMEVSGKKVTDFALRPEFYVEGMNMRVLTPLRAIASDLVHRGAYRGDRGKLGVLAEVLGLETKGTVWKG